VRVAVWVITQLGDPKKVYMPIPRQSLFPEGYNKQSGALPANLKVEGGILTCTRSPKQSTKIGSDAEEMIWGDSKWILQIDAPRGAQGEFPDNGSSAEIYTNPDPLKYVELETLGPMSRLKPGERISRTQTYRLYRRSEAPLDEQVKALLAK
jgi:hypothetical protein